MSKQIPRPEAARARVGVGKTKFNEDYLLRDPADPWVPGTNNTVPRLRPVPLGERAIGFFDDETDGTLEALRCLRDQLTPEDLAAMKDAAKADRTAKRAAAKERAAAKRAAEEAARPPRRGVRRARPQPGARP
jgi:hypothetical protein